MSAIDIAIRINKTLRKHHFRTIMAATKRIYISINPVPVDDLAHPCLASHPQ